MAGLRLTLFGSPRLLVGEQDFTNKVTGKALALLVYLALSERPQRRDVVADLLWSELSNQQARNNLRYLLSDLRQLVGDYLTITAQTLEFNRQASYWLDVEELRTTLTANADMLDAQAWQNALNLYQGEFLAGFRVRNAPLFEAWATAQQEELHALTMHGFEQLAQWHLNEGNITVGLQTVQRLLASEPLHETGQRLLMQLLWSSGQRAAALEQYQLFRQLLRDELGVEPSAVTTALYNQIRRGDIGEPVSLGQLIRAPLLTEPSRQDTKATGEVYAQTIPSVDQDEAGVRVEPPALSFTAAPKHNLPRQLTPLIGRKQELMAVSAKLLEPAYPLLVLIGEGGIGKTRLALAVAEQVQKHFADGVWFVPLSGITPADDLRDQLAGAIGEAFRFAFAGREPLHVQLLTQLRHKHLLLVLDNFEHLVDGASFLLELLQAAPGVKLLATSRRQLDLQTEYPWSLDGLNFPSGPAVDALAERELLAYESIALFVERARRTRPNFQFDQENRAEIVRICQFVEGSPLGIELAATLVKQRSCAQIVAALEENYGILTTNLRDIPAPHRSMQTVLTYSWQLLSTEEMRVMARCSVFHAGFSLDAATVVVGATPDLLTSLVGHSLLYQGRDSAGQVRYTMHEVVRQYAAEQLQRSTTAARQAHEQHCTYYAAFLQAQEAGLKRNARTRYQIQADLDNVRAAWRWAIEQTRIDAVGQGIDCLSAFYEFVGFFQEAETLFGQASQAIQRLLAQPNQYEVQAELLLGHCLLEQAGFCVHLGHLQQACQLARTTIELGKQHHNCYLHADGCRRLGEALQEMGDFSTAYTVLQEGLALARQGNIPQLIAYCLQNLGVISYNQGGYRKAVEYYQEALAVSQPLDDLIIDSPMIHNLGAAYLVLGDFSQALLYLEQDIRISRELGWQRLLAFANLNMGYLLGAVGEFARAQLVLEEALALFTHLGCRSEQANTLSPLGVLFRFLGDYTKSYTFCMQALEMAEALNDTWQRGLTLIDLGDTLVAMQRWQEAVYMYEQALSIWQNVENPGQLALTLAALAFVYLQQQKLAEAQTLVERALPDLESVSSEGIRVFLACYQVLATTADRRAHEVLHRGYQFIQTQLASIHDEALRRSFLEKVPVNRELMTLAHLHLGDFKINNGQ